MVRVMKSGMYKVWYQTWVIYFPYSSNNYMFFGSSKDLQKEVERLKKGPEKHNQYGPKIRDVTKELFG